MSLIPAELKYIDSHEWLKLEEDGTVTLGITAHAVEMLGDIVYVELPEVSQELAQGDAASVVESVKAASDVYTPIAGEVVEINEALVDSPEILNEDPYDKGWFFRLKIADPSVLSALLTAKQYEALIAEE